MADVPYVFRDAALTEPFDPVDGGIGAWSKQGDTAVGVFYVGATDAGFKLQATSNPGVDPIALSIVDSSPGSGVEATAIRLAVSEAGLAAATPGAALNIGDTVLGGAVNAIEVWFDWANSIGGGEYTEISIDIVPPDEVPV